MRLLFFLTTALSLICTSCLSEQPAMDDSMAEIPISIDISFEKQYNGNIITKETTTHKSILYIVYNEPDGSYLKHKSLGGNSIVSLSDTLPAGRYRIAVLSAEGDALSGLETSLTSDIFPGAAVNFGSAAFYLYPEYRDVDYFYNHIIIDVAGVPLKESVVLQKITTKLEIAPADAALAPEGLQKIYFGIENMSLQYFSFNNRTSKAFVDNPSQVLPDAVYSFVELTRQELMSVTANNPVTILLLPVGSPYELVTNMGKEDVWLPITATLDFDAGRIKFVLKNEYQLQPNHVLRLTGNLFTLGGNIVNSVSHGNAVFATDEWQANVATDDLQ